MRVDCKKAELSGLKENAEAEKFRRAELLKGEQKIFRSEEGSA